MARPAAAAGAVRRGGALTVEGTALALLRSNHTAVLRPGPQFPGSGGRSGASGRPPNPATVLAAARCCSGAYGGRGGRWRRPFFVPTVAPSAAPAGAVSLPGRRAAARAEGARVHPALPPPPCWALGTGGGRVAAPVRPRHGAGAIAAARVPGALGTARQ